MHRGILSPQANPNPRSTGDSRESRRNKRQSLAMGGEGGSEANAERMVNLSYAQDKEIRQGEEDKPKKKRICCVCRETKEVRRVGVG